VFSDGIKIGIPMSVTKVGQSERALVRLASRYALWLRTAIVALTGVFGVVAAESDVRWPMTAVVGFVVGCCFFQVGRELRGPRPIWLATVDGMVVVLVGLSQAYFGPQQVSSWIFAVVSISSVTCHYEWPRRSAAGWVLAGLATAAYGVGNQLAGPDDGLVGLCTRLAVQSLLTWMSFRFLLTGARTADRMGERVASRRREADVAAARRAAERAYFATLHDTASTTLLMVSLGTSDEMAWLPDRAQRDLEILGAVPGSTAREIDLASVLTPLTQDPELRIELDVRGPLVMPAGPAVAIFLGAREALNNVRQHAGDRNPSLRAGRDDAGRVVVELSDRGRGFRPTSVSVHRRGISVSIIERMAAAGGNAEVVTLLGTGTTVRWTWPDE
jgi:hypothetical protein